MCLQCPSLSDILGIMNPVKGKPKIRLKDIAAQSGVSIATVSMVLSNRGQIGQETKQRIRKICQDMGYRPPARQNQPADSPAASAISRRFGLIYIAERRVIDKHDQRRWDAIQNLSNEALKLNLRLEVLCISDEDADDFCEKHLEQFLSELDAVLLSGFVRMNLLRRIRESQKPCVVMGGIEGDVQQQHEFARYVHVIKTNWELAGRLAASCLISAGHRRIAFVAERIVPGLFFDQWLSGYRLAHLDAGLGPDNSLLVTTGMALSGGAPAADVVLPMTDRPTAYVIPDARIAASFIAAMNVAEPLVRMDNTVICQVVDATVYAMEGYPQIGSALDHDAQLCFEQLIRLCENPHADVYEIATPLVSQNLDKIKRIP